MRRIAPLLLCMLAPLAIGCGGGPRLGDDPAYLAQIEAWHAQRIERLRSESGWLTLVGLLPLHEGVNAVGSAADADAVLPAKAPELVGTVTRDADGFLFAAASGADVFRTVDGDTVPVVRLALTPDDPGPPTVLHVGSLSFYVIVRGDRSFLRVKDSDSEVRRDFTDVPRFPVDERWRVTARLEPRENHRGVMVGNVLGQQEESPCPGTLVFTLEGRACSLAPIGEPGDGLFIVFGDATNGTETYGGGRFLDADPPDSTGAVVLDFNKAYDPPCVFTPYATCPLPPQENVLPLAVTAGEKTWGDH